MPPQTSKNNANAPPQMVNCLACSTVHHEGYCRLKLAGVEKCPLCGIAHYGHARVCPHIGSETQVRQMLEALRNSNEEAYLVKAATKYLRGVKGHLVQSEKLAREKLEKEQRGEVPSSRNPTTSFPPRPISHTAGTQRPPYSSTQPSSFSTASARNGGTASKLGSTAETSIDISSSGSGPANRSIPSGGFNTNNANNPAVSAQQVP
ncbi:hypothetical protein K402DRAFT_390767 [Aulographum hederae CBS 113979]|uniref:Mit1 C-terminal Zn finger 2 domain-containing protein n=1 Tax=Aulographum hederae CBS 113979 TaxID=1176131 RepID=A0A6G1H986_9PEZI|nr:hypothetical protein K402DRAFT_390767 [Aulographum hederae CBS 113979]